MNNFITVDTHQDKHIICARDHAVWNRDHGMIEMCNKILHSENGAASAAFAVVRYYNRYFGSLDEQLSFWSRSFG